MLEQTVLAWEDLKDVVCAKGKETTLYFIRTKKKGMNAMFEQLLVAL